MDASRSLCALCTSPLRTDGVGLAPGVGRCRACGAVFRLEPGAGSAPADVPLPRHVRLDRDDGGLILTMRWFRLIALFLLLWCTLWDGVLLFAWGLAITRGVWQIFAFSSLHMAAGVAMTWYTAALFLNRTVVRAQAGRLEVRHAPIWAPGQCDLAAADLRRLWVRERGSRHRTTGYELWVRREGGKDVKLVDGLDQVEQAFFLADILGRQLGLRAG